MMNQRQMTYLWRKVTLKLYKKIFIVKVFTRKWYFQEECLYFPVWFVLCCHFRDYLQSGNLFWLSMGFFPDDVRRLFIQIKLLWRFEKSWSFFQNKISIQHWENQVYKALYIFSKFMITWWHWHINIKIDSYQKQIWRIKSKFEMVPHSAIV